MLATCRNSVKKQIGDWFGGENPTKSTPIKHSWAWEHVRKLIRVAEKSYIIMLIAAFLHSMELRKVGIWKKQDKIKQYQWYIHAVSMKYACFKIIY